MLDLERMIDKVGLAVVFGEDEEGGEDKEELEIRHEPDGDDDRRAGARPSWRTRAGSTKSKADKDIGPSSVFSILVSETTKTTPRLPRQVMIRNFWTRRQGKNVQNIGLLIAETVQLGGGGEVGHRSRPFEDTGLTCMNGLTSISRSGVTLLRAWTTERSMLCMNSLAETIQPTILQFALTWNVDEDEDEDEDD